MRAFSTAALLALLAASPLAGGGTFRVETRTRMMMGEGSSTEWVNPERKKTELNLQMGGMMAGMARMGGFSGHAITIDRVDKGVVWTLDPEKKTYRERPIGQIERQAGPGGRGDKPGRKFKVVDSGMKVTATGRKQILNGWSCAQYLVEGFIEMEDEQTKERSKWTMNSELWTTAAAPLLKRYQEAEAAHARARLAKMGMNSDSELTGKLGFEALAGRNGMQGGDIAPAMAKMGAELKKVSGVPILTKFDWIVSGAATASAAKAQKEMDPQTAAMMKKMGVSLSPGGGVGIGGEIEIKSVKEEETDFDLPAGYAKSEK